MINTSQLAFISRLLSVVGESTPLQDAFLLADDVLRQVTVFPPSLLAEIQMSMLLLICASASAHGALLNQQLLT